MAFYASHGHAKVERLHYHGDTPGIELLIETTSDLARKALLYLEASAEDVDNSRELTEAYDLAARDVGYVTFAIERKKMVLTKTEEIYVSQDDHFVIVLLENRVANGVLDALTVSACEKAERGFDSLGGLEKAFSIRVLSETRDEFANKWS